MNISERRYAELCRWPVTQQVLGLSSALANVVRLMKDVMLMILSLKSPSALNQQMDNNIASNRRKIRRIDHDDVTKDPEEIAAYQAMLEESIERDEFLKIYPSKHLQGILEGIISATPIVGTVYSCYSLTHIP